MSTGSTGIENEGQKKGKPPSTPVEASTLLSMFEPPPGIPNAATATATATATTATESTSEKRPPETPDKHRNDNETETEIDNDDEDETPKKTNNRTNENPISEEDQPASHSIGAAADGSVADNNDNPLVSPVAASLLEIFEPPETHRVSAVGTSSGSSSHQGASAELLAVFDQPPPAAATAAAITTDSPTGTAAPSSPRTSLDVNSSERRSTIRQANLHDNNHAYDYRPETNDNGGRSSLDNLSEHTSLLQSLFTMNEYNDNMMMNENDKTPRTKKVTLDRFNNNNKTAFQHLLAPSMQTTTRTAPASRQHDDDENDDEQDDDDDDDDGYHMSVKQQPDNNNNNKNSGETNTTFSWKGFFKTQFQPTTFAGAFMFLLYHVVFCLANGSAIVRPHSSQPILGTMAKLTAVGILFAGPFYIARLGNDVPALYPSVDLFLAPFLASAAATVDQILVDDGIESNTVFFASFAVLAAIGMFSAGTVLLLAATFRLANLGSFMPYSVLSGFFSAVGVLLWALAFSVDNHGKTWQRVFFSGDLKLIVESLMHHIPSLAVGILMNLLGPKHPFYVILLIILTLLGFYTTMWITGTSLEEAQEQQWFWSRNELSVQPTSSPEGMLSFWVPPIPFGHFGALMQGQVHWRAVSNGLKDMFVLSFLYLLRSSIHASAMKKNINNLVCKKRVKKPKTKTTIAEPQVGKKHRRESSYAEAAMAAISNNVRLVNESLAGAQTASGAHQSIRPINSPQLRSRRESRLELPRNAIEPQEYEIIEERPKPCRKNLQGIFVEYGYALMLVAFSGGFGVCPTVATSNTMFAIGAGRPAPQYGSVLLLIVFYMTDFDLVRYIPKACFSSLLVLGAVDTFVVWFFLSYRKTQDLTEWLVVPFIVAFSLIVGFLNAVFLGVGISTFIFVASFFRVGVVKFNATGLEIRSTIERSLDISDWLDMHGDYIQVLVLQNYLFFGNASSVLNYISTMFEDVESSESFHSGFDLPPLPKILIIDMSLITGMDTSTLDIFAEIKELCKNNDCKLFLVGLSRRAKKGLSLTGVKPEQGFRDQRLVRFFADLDTALGRAEDLIATELYDKEKENSSSPGRFASAKGFEMALKLIDEQHGQYFSKDLMDLEPHIDAIELGAGERLFACDGGKVSDDERGLFFIESGTLKIERDAGATLTRGRSTLTNNMPTLNNLHARAGTLGRQRAALKASTRDPLTRTFRLARIGPGWVCGAIEGASGMAREGVHVAVTHCRLHHLSFQKLEILEKEQPALILSLYKMLSHLMARRQEITIEQLATFHSIMSSPAHSKPIGRAAMMALKRQ